VDPAALPAASHGDFGSIRAVRRPSSLTSVLLLKWCARSSTIQLEGNVARTAFVCLVTAVTCGILTAGQCSYARGSYGTFHVRYCNVAAARVWIQTGDPMPTSLWAHWINWVPGLLFGLFFSWANVDRELVRWWLRVLAFGLAAAFAYLAAGVISTQGFLVPPLFASLLLGFLSFSGPAFVAGASGSFILLFALPLLTDDHPHINLPRGATWRTVIAGAVLGSLFFLICFFGSADNRISWTLAFVPWQVMVGLSLAWEAERRMDRFVLSAPADISEPA
jgi:hypothetical protein